MKYSVLPCNTHTLSCPGISREVGAISSAGEKWPVKVQQLRQAQSRSAQVSVVLIVKL